MTETTAEVFEKYQVRKTKKQKNLFIDYVRSVASENGYSVKTENGSFGSRNIVVGDPDTAKVVYTAHYDTCARLPFPNFITPKHFIVYLVYQLAIVLGFFLVAFFIGFLFGVVFAMIGLPAEAAYYISLAVYWVFLILMIAGPANKNTANDNTSGVTTLLDIMTSLPEDRRSNVAFVFFDLEEVGLLGSMSFASKHKKTMKDKLLMNFDCVSDGENMLFFLRQKSAKYEDAIARAFEGNKNVNVEILTKWAFYPSDQMNFSCGVGVASLNRSKFFKILYMNRIHTKRDTVYREENIEFLKEGAVKLLELL